MTRPLPASVLLDHCKSARRLGETLGARIPDAPPELLWGTVRLAVLGLPVGLDPEQERQIFDVFAMSHRSSSATMRVAVPVDAPDNKRTQIIGAPTQPPAGLVVSQWIDPGPPDEDAPVPPLDALGTLLRSLRDWWRPKPDQTKLRTLMVRLLLECERHRREVEAMGRELDETRRGRL